MQDFTRDESLDDLLAGLDKGKGDADGDAGRHVGGRIHALREYRGVSLQQLAEKTGFSAAILSQIENRMASPPLGALVKIANALETSVSTIVGGKEEREFSIVRREERETVPRPVAQQAGRAGYTYEALGAGKAGRKMEPFIVRLQPLGDRSVNRNSHEGEEFLFVLSGEVEVVLDHYSDVLHEGDSVYYNSTIPHHVHSAGDRESVILAVIFQGR
ncbi:MAG TPA: XRE family transcriptional regulator [Candidatus Deferrimicrobiaceae bacterium]